MFGTPSPPRHYHFVERCLLCMFRAWHSVRFKIKILGDGTSSKHNTAASTRPETEYVIAENLPSMPHTA